MRRGREPAVGRGRWADVSPSRTHGPRRDLAAPALAVLLFACALPVIGWAPAPGLPSEPTRYLGLAAAVLACVLLALGPTVRGAAARVTALLLAAWPFLHLALLEGGFPPGGARLSTGALLLPAAVFAVGYAGRWRHALAATLVVLVGSGTVFALAGLPLLPPGWNPVTEPFGTPVPPGEPAGPGAASAPQADGGPRFPGAPRRLPPGTAPALGAGPGPWWVDAPEPRPAGPRPVVLLLDGARTPPAGVRLEDATFVHGSQGGFEHAFDLEPFDAVVVRENAWGRDDPRARQRAAALATFVRWGGLLVGPAPTHAGPPDLIHALGPAARDAARGPDAATRIGFGRFARGGARAEVEALLAEGLWVPVVSTALDAGAAGPVPWPAALARWEDRPGRRRVQGALLALYVLALGTLGWAVRDAGARVLATLLLAGAVSVGLAWTSSADPGVVAHGVVLDLDGAGGRRIEAVALHAGPAGWTGRVVFAGGGRLRLLGARLDAAGRVRVAPGHAAWAVRVAEARHALPTAPDPAGLALRGLLRGSVRPRDLRPGRLDGLPVRVEGLGPLPGLALGVRAP